MGQRLCVKMVGYFDILPTSSIEGLSGRSSQQDLMCVSDAENQQVGQCRGTVVALYPSHRSLCEVKAVSYRTRLGIINLPEPDAPGRRSVSFQSALQFLQMEKLGVGWRTFSFVRRGIRCVCHTTKAWLMSKKRRTDARESKRRVTRLFSQPSKLAAADQCAVFRFSLLVTSLSPDRQTCGGA